MENGRRGSLKRVLVSEDEEDRDSQRSSKGSKDGERCVPFQPFVPFPRARAPSSSDVPRIQPTLLREGIFLRSAHRTALTRIRPPSSLSFSLFTLTQVASKRRVASSTDVFSTSTRFLFPRTASTSTAPYRVFLTSPSRHSQRSQLALRPQAS